MDYTVIIPFWNGNKTIQKLIDSIHEDLPIIVVVDANSEDIKLKHNKQITILNLEQRGYFSGAVNEGIKACDTDVLILNQDTWFENDQWISCIEENKKHYDMFGEGVFGHKAWPNGYVQGTFMFIKRTALNINGALDSSNYPLWGSTCEWQLRAARKDLSVLPLKNIPGLHHKKRTAGQFGDAVAKALHDEPSKHNLFLRTPPSISVVIPCYNYGRYLQEAIDSLMEQSLQSFEIVIVDDCSTDGSDEIAQGFANGFKGIRVFKHKQNQGTAATINTAIANAKGYFITVLSADDMMTPHRLEEMYNVAIRDTTTVVYDDIVWRTNKKDSTKKMYDEYDFDALLQKNIMHSGIMYPKKAWQEVGGYPAVMSDGREDWAFNIALGRAGYCGVHISKAMYVYRRQKQNRSLTNTTPKHHQYFLNKLMALYPELYQGDRPMGCCGRGRGGKSPAKRVVAKPAARNASKAKLTGSGTLLEYIGRNMGTETWYGNKSGKVYKFGRNPRRRLGYVEDSDVKAFVQTGNFRLAKKITPHPQPVKVKEPEVVELQPQVNKLDDMETQPNDEDVNATLGAIKYAKEVGVDLIEMESKERITKKAVEDYARRSGKLA